MSDKKLLEVKNLHVDVEDKQILHGVNLEIGKGETHVLMGPNGTGSQPLDMHLWAILDIQSERARYGLMVRTSQKRLSMSVQRQEYSSHSRIL